MTKQKILIIDDETDVHYSFRRLLQNEDLEILSAESGEEGIRKTLAEQPGFSGDGHSDGENQWA